MAVLYWYKDQWYVSTWETPDGSEQIIHSRDHEGKYYYYSRKPVCGFFLAMLLVVLMRPLVL